MSDSKPMVVNFLPEQYRLNKEIAINHNYLAQQFSDHEQILERIRQVVIRGDFTLGEEVDILEMEFASLCNTRYAISVGSGTDALFLTLKAIGVGQGDEVITTPFTFYATVGAIVTAGARPVFVDVGSDFNIDPSLIEARISERTKAIMPVHWAGRPCDMNAIERVAAARKIPVIADACHAIKASYFGRQVGELGTAACFSFHPLKNLNVWGDGGIVTTNSSEIAHSLRLLRNHGLVNRDVVEIFAYNSRLDTIQATVARHMLKKLDHITHRRISNASYLDKSLGDIATLKIPQRHKDLVEVFHLYQVLCESRDDLQKFLIANQVDAKVHYPTPMHLQPAASSLGYQRGDFPNAEAVARKTLSLPVHEFITSRQLDYVADLIREFYAK